jgi:hypothetical protein
MAWILLSNQRELLPGLRKAMNDAGVPFEPPRAETFIDSDTGMGKKRQSSSMCRLSLFAQISTLLAGRLRNDGM